MNKKIFGIVVAFLAVSLMLTPLTLAKPGAPKKNDKFEFFELVCSGAMSGDSERFWYTPPNADILENKTTHIRSMGWITGNTVELTVGEKSPFTMDSIPYSITWTTTFDADIIRYNDGTQKRSNIRLTDVVTVYKDDAVIGTLVLNLKSAIDFSTMPPGYSGTMQGYGTEALAGVHISGIDIGLVDPVNAIFMRNGTITGWPTDITND